MMERLVSNRRRLALLSLLLVAVSGVGIVLAQQYFNRQYVMTVDVSGAITAEIVLNTPAGYEAKTPATVLPGIFTFWVDNTGAAMWMNVTSSGAPAGMTVSFSGQYLHYEGPPANSFTDVGTPIDLTGYHLIDKTKCSWGGANAGGLRITMTWTGSPTAGSYPITVRVQVGT